MDNCMLPVLGSAIQIIFDLHCCVSQIGRSSLQLTLSTKKFFSTKIKLIMRHYHIDLRLGNINHTVVFLIMLNIF
jgi:hypothetical protein